MKQSITEKQWLELSKEQQDTFIMVLVENHGFEYWKVEKVWERVTIGMMIEFLKEEENDIFIDKYFSSNLQLGFAPADCLRGVSAPIAIGWDDDEEFCDALFKSVKQKLQSK